MSTRAERIAEALQAVFRPAGVSVREGEKEIHLCGGASCHGSGSDGLRDAFEAELERRGLRQDWRIVETGCFGLCGDGPVVIVLPAGVFYPRVAAEAVPRIVQATLVDGRPAEELLYRHPATGRPLAHLGDIPFHQGQTRVTLSLGGLIDPACIDDYLARAGYGALAAALGADDPDQVVDAVEQAGLRARGAETLLAADWRLAEGVPSEERYVVCSVDEGDPGAFVDRTLVESEPHAVVEGMLLAAYAVGARRGIVHLRPDQRLAGERLRAALAECRERGLLGHDILTAGLIFDITVHEGPGALVCGDDTALLAALEGRRAMPRVRPPQPAEQGLWGRPTVVADAATYATVPWVVRNGAAAYMGAGVHRHPGTRVVSLGGRVAAGGVLEVAAGTSLRHVVMDIGGGPLPGHTVKAVQVGGPLGDCLPAAALEAPIDELLVGGSSLVVLDDRTCMVDLARHLLSISQRGSCGKCVPCRLGTKRSLEILERIVAGNGRDGDVELLEELGEYCSEGTMCAVGGGAARPVLATLHAFRDEYDAHILDKRCPAGTCRALITYFIDPEACTGCALCAERCPQGVISGRPDQPYVIDASGCSKCDICRQVCPEHAVKLRSGISQTVMSTAG